MLKQLQKASLKSNHKHRHAVMVERGGNILAIGYNHDHRHAEVDALNKLWPSERKHTHILSVRFTKTGKLAMAKPCPKCEQFLIENGVKKVTYSDSFGKLHTIKLGRP